MVSEVALLWAAHHPGPFPDVPFDHRHDLAYLDFDMAGCVMTYLRNDDVPGPGAVEVLRDCSVTLDNNNDRNGCRTATP